MQIAVTTATHGRHYRMRIMGILTRNHYCTWWWGGERGGFTTRESQAPLMHADCGRHCHTLIVRMITMYMRHNCMQIAGIIAKDGRLYSTRIVGGVTILKSWESLPHTGGFTMQRSQEA